MATLNSLLFLFSTLAPNMEPPGNSPVTQVPLDPQQMDLLYRQNVPVLRQTACKLGEHPSCQYHCQKNCTNYGEDFPCPDICVFGCVCIDPFIRATDGSCIMPYECPATPDFPVTTDTTDEYDDIQCQPDEEVSKYAHCQRNCSNIGETIVCPGEGRRGCVCKSPRIRGPDGSCIMSDDCPPIQRKPQLPVISQPACNFGEHPSCLSHCQKDCTNYDQDIPCPDICVFNCMCVEPFIRGPDGSCIMPYQCPAISDTSDTTDTTDESVDIQCQSDEEVSRYAHCQRSCANVGEPIVCSREGHHGCVCKLPRIRGPDGSCIMSHECPPTQRKSQFPVLSQTACQLGEHPSCQSHCQKNCTNYDQDIPCPDICVFGCVCIDPFIRGPDGSCIMPYQCPDTPDTSVTTDTTEEPDDFQCQSDEEMSSYAHCQRNCTNVGQMIICPGEGPRGCVCKSPKIRGPDGSCIISDECPSNLRRPQDPDDARNLKCEINEEVSCFSHCQRNCTNYNKKFHCPMYCVTGCVCSSPLIRGPDGSCIMPEQCNEFMAPQKAQDRPCRDSQECDDTDDTDKENEANLRAFSGPFDHLTCKDENEVYKLCSSQCPDNCENYRNTRRACKLICLPFPKCECKDGFVRGPNGECIAPEQCPQGEKGQLQSKDRIADEWCQFVHIFNQSICQSRYYWESIASQTCLDMDMRLWMVTNFLWRCDPELYTGVEFHCCPNSFFRGACPVNEEYKKCGTACQKNCEDYDQDIPCESDCESGCFCREPLIRGPGGKCIPKEECPARSNVPSLSSESCPENEEYKECGTACQKNCRDYDRDIPCEFKCESGCFCREPLIRGPGGKCIHKEDCPARSNVDTQPIKNSNLGFLPDFPRFSCKEYEIFSVCASVCPDNCNNYQEDRLCKKICVPGCKCIEGYVKGKDGKCMKIEDCEKKNDNICHELEVYSDCGSHCETDCYNYDATDRKCEDSSCNPGCFCKPGLVRSPDGRCIPAKKCPKRDEPFWSSSKQVQTFKDYRLMQEQCRFVQIRNQSICQGLYDWVDTASHSCLDMTMKLRLFLGVFKPCGVDLFTGVEFVCCPKNFFSKVCHDNEEYKECGTACQKNCQDYDRNIPCESKCESGCFCKEPLIRGPDGKCIHKEDCLAKSNLPKREEFKSDFLTVPEQCLFDHIHSPITCQSYDDWKNPADHSCLDRSMQLRSFSMLLPCGVNVFSGVQFVCCPKNASNGNCPVNEEYKECATACQKDCRDYDRNIPCESVCETGCFCREPLIRGPGGKCILKEDCPARPSVPTQPVKNSKQGFLPDFPRFSCKEHEEFSVCAPFCPDNCTNYQEDRLCKKICLPGCKCIEGYVKGKDGNCIKKEECEENNSHVCHKLEDYKDCGSHCETDCYNYDVTDRKCEDSSCKPGCFCKTGLVRSPDGRCIPADECPAQDESSWNTKIPK